MLRGERRPLRRIEGPEAGRVRRLLPHSRGAQFLVLHLFGRREAEVELGDDRRDVLVLAGRIAFGTGNTSCVGDAPTRRDISPKSDG